MKYTNPIEDLKHVINFYSHELPATAEVQSILKSIDEQHGCINRSFDDWNNYKKEDAAVLSVLSDFKKSIDIYENEMQNSVEKRVFFNKLNDCVIEIEKMIKDVE